MSVGKLATELARFRLRPEQARRFVQTHPRISAAECRSLWAYRKQRLTIARARDQIGQIVSKYPVGRGGKFFSKDPDDPICPRIIHAKTLIEKRKEHRKECEAQEQIDNVVDLDDRLMGYQHGYGCKVNLGNGELLILERNEEVEWTHKNHKWPHKRTTYTATVYTAKFDLRRKVEFDRRGKWKINLQRTLSIPLLTSVRSKTQLQNDFEEDRGYVRVSP